MLKRKRIIIPIIIVIMLCALLLSPVRYFIFGTSSKAVSAKSNADFGIEDIVSSVDMDGDGTDDQTDILSSAREYIATGPRYKSKYYNTGYPDDGYGVCTDVIAVALLNSGYDLMTLVNEDILADPSDYGIDEPDINIDFRRVRNLKVYFDHTAISLTTDIYDTAQWQGGDIVVFEDHIGIVSDQRNSNGVPYIIHHANPFQKSYEEDVLGKYTVLGHYRISE